ncbi:MAG: hypothetical protein JNK02_17330 [Planctomycetes bacterium]|nr:hypothetical protein [Planctomycetota bacterium]
MTAPIATYRTRPTGIWSPHHEILDANGRIGVLQAERNRWSLTTRATWRPEKGEVLTFRRDPGLLRSQFSVWTDGREWLGSSLRSRFFGREIALSTPSKSLRMLPVPGFQRGWRLHAPKTGELARITPDGLGKASTLQVFRRVELELVLFAYFVGALVYAESYWPGPAIVDDLESLPTAPSKA